MTDTWAKRLAPWFEHRRWRVMAELTGEVLTGPSDSVRVCYAAGAFEIDPPGVFVTPLGHRGRRGYVVERTDGEGSEKAERAAFGGALLRRAQAAFGTISGIPEED